MASGWWKTSTLTDYTKNRANGNLVSTADCAPEKATTAQTRGRDKIRGRPVAAPKRSQHQPITLNSGP